METSPMKRIVLKYGLGSGAVVATLMSASVGLYMSGRIDAGDSELLGYSTMVLAFLLVFFGIRSYRDNVGGGRVSFGRADIGTVAGEAAAGVVDDDLRPL